MNDHEISTTKLSVALISLGCDKNTVDSEEMLGILSEHGYLLTEDPAEADAAIVNTCCFIQDATEESISWSISGPTTTTWKGFRYSVGIFIFSAKNSGVFGMMEEPPAR